MSDAQRADSDLVTGDAVVLDLRLAQLPTRALSMAIDITVQLLVLSGLTGIVGAVASSLDDAATAALLLVTLVAVILGYPVAFETLSRGRTLGKIALGLRVVRDDGGPERFRQALFRGLAEIVEIWLTFGTIALFASLFSSRGKRVGDIFAGTVVIRERMPTHTGRTAWMPPALAPWAQSADLSRVPDALALAARQLLARWPELDAAAREQTAVRLATEIGRFVSPPSPPGTPAAAYLAAVLAERRRRDQRRLMPMPTTSVQHSSAQRPSAERLPSTERPPPAEETSTGGGFTLPG